MSLACGLPAVGRRLAAPGLALAHRGALLARSDAQALDPSRVGIEHFDFKIAGARDDFAAHRQPPDVSNEVAAEGLDFLTGFAGDELLADHGADVLEAGAGIGDEGVVGLADDRRRRVAVMFVVDLADDLFDNVLDRHQAVGAAIFVHHQGEMDPRGLHLRQQIDRPHRGRRVEQFADDVGVLKRQREIDRAQVETRRKRLLAFDADRRHPRLRGHERQEIADMDDPLGIIEGLVIDDEARMRRALEQAHQFAERNIALAPQRCRRGGSSRRRCAAHAGRGYCAAWCARSAEKPVSSGVEASSTTCRSSRTDPGFHPNRVRIARVSQILGGGAHHLAVMHHGRQVAGVPCVVLGRVGSPASLEPRS